MNSIGDNLRRHRGNESQASFARKLGIKNQQTYQRYEEGARQPRASVLHHMASIIGVSVGELMGESPVGRESSPAYGSTSERLAEHAAKSGDKPIPNYCLKPEPCTYANDDEQQREARLMSVWAHWKTMASQTDPIEIDAQAKAMHGIIDRYAELLKTKAAKGEKV